MSQHSGKRQTHRKPTPHRRPLLHRLGQALGSVEPLPQQFQPRPAETLEPRILLAADVIITEIMHHPVPYDPGTEYIELYNRGDTATSLKGWQFTKGIDYTFGEVTLPPKSYLVVAGDLARFRAKYPAAANAVGGWIGRLSNSQEQIQLTDAAGTTIDSVTYADQGDWAVRRRGPVDHGHQGWVWEQPADGSGASLELINLAMTNNEGQNWQSSTINQGTPGAANSVARDNIAPMILDLRQTPILPRSTESVTITTRIVDELGTAKNATLYYRVDAITPPPFTALAMRDDGTRGDAVAGDGIWSVIIPPQANKAVVEFYVAATDGSRTRTWPGPTDDSGTQGANLLYQVDDTVYTGTQPIYRIIMTEAERAELADIGSDPGDGITEEDSNAQMNATFISLDGVGSQIRYNVGVRNRGHGTRHGPPNNFRVNIPSDRVWKDVTALNFNCRYTPAQVMGSAIYRMAGLAAADAIPVQLRVNSADLAAGMANMFGSYVLLEDTDSDFAHHHFPQDPLGNLYSAFRLDPAGIPEADLRYEGADPTVYRDRYIKETNAEADDFSDLIRLTDVLNNAPDATYLHDVSQVINLQQWLRYLAVDSLLLNWETGLDRGVGDDYAFYRGVNDPRFVLIPHDLDTVLGQGNSAPPVSTSIFSCVDGTGGNNGVDGLRRLLNHPDIVPLFYQSFLDVIDSLFNPQALNPLIDQLLGSWAAKTTIDAMKKFVVDRTDAVLRQIPRQFTVTSPLPLVSGYRRSTTPTAALSGTADVVKTRSVVVNGQVIAWQPRTGRWTASSIPLNPGINRVLARAYDGPNGTGNILAEDFVDILYDNSGTSWTPPQPDVQSLTLFTPDSYRPGTPILIQVSALDGNGQVQRDLWDASVTLSTDRPDIVLSKSQITLANGFGSILAEITGPSATPFTLTATLGTHKISRTLTPLADAPMTAISGTLPGASTTWSGIVHVTGDLRIPAGHTLTLNPGTLVLIDGVASGENGIDIDVEGSIQSLGTADHPVVFTAYDPAKRWGEIHHNNASPSLYQHTILNLAGNSPRGGHSNTGPLFRTLNSKLTFDHVALTDNAGKIMQASGSDLIFLDSHFARSVMGPEISGTALLLQDTFIFDMRNPDDADGIYIWGQQPGQTVKLTGGMIGFADDDAIDTLNSAVTVEDVIVRNTKDKGLSVYNGSVTVTGSLFVDNGLTPEDGASTAISAKSNAGAIATVTLDHTTIISATIGLQAKDKYNTDNDTVNYIVTNSIIAAPDPIQIDPTYPITANFNITYTNTFGENTPGAGNLNADPLFASRGSYNFHLQPGSPSINAGNPASPADPDGSRADQGRYLNNTPASLKYTLLPAGKLTQNMHLTPAAGPYRITGLVEVPAGVTLTVAPGVSIFFDPNAGLTINGGRLLAEGSEYAPIRFTRTLGTAGPWAGLQLLDTMQGNRITHAVIEYGGLSTNNGMVGLTRSNLLLDRVTFDHTDRRRIRTEDSSLIVRNCTFTDIFPGSATPTTDNLSEHIWGSGIPAGGHFIIENNLFGVVKGHNDAIDFDTAPGTIPVPQILNNIFRGSGDDALDLETDAYIEGNTFLHIRKDAHNKASGNSNAMSLGSGRTYTVVRNVFIDMDHIAQVKDNSFLNFVNNTVVGAAFPAIYFRRPDNLGTYGRGAFVDGSIFKQVPAVFGSYTPSTQLTLNHSIVPADDLARGIGNLLGDPRLLDPASADVRLRPGSPALGTGPNGLDMGALVPAGASVLGEPPALTPHTDAILTVAGPGITHYRYRLDNGLWSGEQPIATPIQLSNLPNGPHAVSVLGKNAAGVWQSESQATPSRTWTVNASLPGLRINEVLAANSSAANVNGAYPDLVELFNAGPSPISLAGMSLTDDPASPRRFIFPAATTLNPGQYLVLYADSATAPPGFHLGFSLKSTGEGVYLYSSSGALIDSVAFGQQITDLSIGRLADGAWRLAKPTLGSANIAQSTGDPSRLRINEWLAAGVAPYVNDFIELHNPDSLPIDLSGFYLTDNPGAWPNRNPIAPLTFVPAAGMIVFQADSDPEQGPEHADFSLAHEQGMIGLFSPTLQRIDTILYTPQRAGISQGRSPNDAATLAFFPTPNPGVDNPCTTAQTKTINLIAIDADNWSYNLTDAFTDTAWAQPAYDDRAWPTARAAFYTDNDPFPAGIPKTTRLSTNRTTFYFRKHFTLDDLASVTALSLSAAVDDGAVIYLNGREIARIAMADGPVTYTTLSNRPGTWEPALEGPFAIDKSLLLPGDNVLAVEVHQKSGSADAAFAATLDAVARTTAAPPSLRITEINYNPPGAGPIPGDDYQFLELRNTGTAPLNLNGIRLTAAIDYVFPDLALAPGENIVLARNPTAFVARYGSGIRVVGPFSGALSNNGEEIRLVDAAGNVIQDFIYSDAWHPATDGPGHTLVILNPAADPSTWSSPASWAPSRFVLGSPGMNEPTDAADTVLVNEILSHSHAAAPDWIELLNTTHQPLDLSGWYLSDSPGDLRKFRIPDGTALSPGGYLVFNETDHFANPTHPGARIPFALSEMGDDVYLSAADATGRLTGYRHHVQFGAAETGVSFGRYTNSISQTEYPALNEPTPGLPNASPKVGPIVISELMYHPQSKNAPEFIELRNLSGATVPLFDPLHPQNTWRFTDGIDFTFPPNASIPAFGFALVVSIDPVAFRTAYNIPDFVPIFGPFANGTALSNSGEHLALSKPANPDPDGAIPWIVVDHIAYGTASPWPIAPDGNGPSLARRLLLNYGNDPASWEPGRASGTPGTYPLSYRGRPDTDGLSLSLLNPDTILVAGTPLPLSGTGTIVFQGLSGDDSFQIDLSAGNPIPPAGLLIDGAAGINHLRILHAHPADRLDLSNTQLTINGRPVLFSNVDIELANKPGGSIELAALTLRSTAKLTLPSGSPTWLRTNELHLDSNATLDLTDNTLLVRNGSLAQITAAIQRARASNWTGPGLTSSLARANKQTGLAVLLNDKGDGTPILSSLDGQPLAPGDIIVKATWNGDINLDGVVDAADYFRIDSGYITQKSGYQNGDLNFDGAIDAADYFLIDSAYIAQNTSLASISPPTEQPRLVPLQLAPPKRETSLPSLFSITPLLE